MRDYRERKVVAPNRPKAKRGAGGTLFMAVAIPALVCYLLGIGTGWFIFGRSKPAPPVAAVAPATAPAVVTPTGHPLPAATGPAHDPQLTFFENLPKGKVLGTGINAPKEPAPPQTPPAAPSKEPVKPSAPQPAAPPAAPEKPAAPAASPAQPKPAAPAIAPPAQPKPAVPPAPAADKGKGKYTVQVASYTTKEEADSLKSKLVSSGYESYIVELAPAGKGKWYRVRVGKGLELPKANEIAGKLGSGAVVLLE